jgi:small subunit ribosomal protein S20
MPIKHAALKQLRKDRRRARHNQAVRSSLKTLKERVRSLLTQQKREEALQLLPMVMRRVDRAGAKGIIHHNTAARAKSRLMRTLSQSQPPPSTGGPAPTSTA